MHDADGGVGVGDVALAHESHAQPSDLDDRRLVGGRIRILDVDFADREAREAVVRAIVEIRFLAAGPPHRQCEHDNLVLQVAGNVECDRRRVLAREVERRSIGKDAARLGDLYLTEREDCAVELHGDEAPRVAEQRSGASFDVPLPEAIVLLEVLGLKEQPFGPDDFIVPRHIFVQMPDACQCSLTFSSLRSSLISTRLVWFGSMSVAPRHCARSRSRNAATTPT